MDHPLLHAEGVHEGFEYRTGRAPRSGAIDLPEDTVVEETGRTDQGTHAHVARIDQ